MKKILLSALSCAMCAVFLLSPLNAYATAPVLEEVIADTVYSEFLGRAADTEADLQKRGIAWIIKKVLESRYSDGIRNATTNQNGDLQITVPRYDLVTGKYQLKWSTYDLNGNVTKNDSLLVECTMILGDSWNFEQYDEATNTTYYSNGLNYSITRSNGSVRKYFVSFPSTFNYNSAVSFSQNSINVSAQNGCTLFDVSGGQINQVIETGFYCASTRFTQNTINSIDSDINLLMTGRQTNNQYSTDISAFYSSYGSTISASSNTLYPVDKDICHGAFLCKYLKLDGTNNSTGVRFDASQYLWTGFVVTNNPSHKNVINQYYITNNTKNYYVDPIDGGTVVNKNNYQEKNLPQLAPAFDIDTSLPDWDLDLLDLLPDLISALGDLFDGDILDMLGKLLDFFGNMPDIGLEWNPDLSLNPNNYFDIELPALPDSGGGGSGGNVVVTVDVNVDFPPVTVQTHAIEDIVSVNTFPVIETYTVPPAIQTQAKTFLDSGESLVTTSGLLPIYAFLTLIGIAVAVIFKGA